MYEVQQTRWDRIIRRVSGSVGPGSRVSETISELFPMIDVERVPGELLILGGTRVAFGSHIFQADPGEFPIVQLFNPADSGNIAVVTKLLVMGALGATVTIRWGPTLAQVGGLTGAETFRDLRMPLTARPVCQVSFLSSAGVGGGTMTMQTLSNVPLDISDENGVMILAPGTGLEVGIGSAASVLNAAFHWRERPAEPSELQF